MIGFVYVTTNRVNGKRYVGKCSYSRPQWRTYLGSGKYLVQAIKKYGRASFTRVIIEEADNDEVLCQRELYYIDLYDAANNRDWYNVYSRSTPNKAFLGRTHTAEHKARMSERFKGIPRPAHVGKAVGDAKRGKLRNRASVQKQIEKISGGNHFRAKSVTVNNIAYDTLTEAFNQTGMSKRELRKLRDQQSTS